jgi:branched-chain amino acid transport system permease protein
MLFVQLLINGLAAGALYAFVALGFALIYNATGILHLAHGAVFALGGYVFYICVAILHLPVVMACLLAICASAAFGIAIDWLVYRPLRDRKADHASSMIASIGVLTLSQAVFGLVFGTDNLAVRIEPLQTITFFGLYVSYLHVLVAVLALVIFSALQIFLVRTWFGRAIRAFADNPKLSRVFGINSGSVNALVFGLGSGLAAVAACLISFDSGVRPDVGFSIMFTALVAVIVGGAGYLPGAAAGGILVGLLQSLSLWPFSARWQEVTVFVVLVAFLLFRPQGLFGYAMLVRRA